MWYSQYQNSHEIFCKVEPSKGISFQAPMLAGTIRKGGEEIKAMVALLVFFIMATLEIVGRKRSI